MTRDVVIIGMLQTPIGCFRGALADYSAVELGGLAARALVERTDVPAYMVDEAILGQVLAAGTGQNPARQSAIKDGLPNSVSAITINDVCGSRLKALHLATRVIQCGEADIVITDGQEDMSRAPHVLIDSRTGTQPGDNQLVDGFMRDGLWDAFDDYHIDVTTENLAREYGISRQLQDAYTLNSQQKTRAAIDAGRSKGEVVPIITRNNGQTLVIDTDEQPHIDTSVEALARLNSSFDSLGSVTAGNTSSINDRAAAIMMMSEAKARALNLPVLAHIHTFASVGVNPALMGIAPMYVTRHCLECIGWRLAGVGLIEANGVFAAQALSVDKMLEWDKRRVNVNDGAIALGHPIGTSGCQILVSLVHEMVRRNVREGLAALYIGEGQGIALAIERDE